MRNEFSHTLPEVFRANITGAWGDEGLMWLDALPGIVSDVEQNWNIKVEDPFKNLSYHFVAPCICVDGSPAVVKIGFPEPGSPLVNEAAMLDLSAGNCMALLLKRDFTRRAVLLERLFPGWELKKVFPDDPSRAVSAAISVLRRMHTRLLPRKGFLPLSRWFAGLENAPRRGFPASAVERAIAVYRELCNGNERLLHGDYHHDNILSAQRQPFLTIDPKGIVGPIGYDISVFLNNHLLWLAADPCLHAAMTDAVEGFSRAFGIPARDLRKWAYAQSVLSAWWTFEENNDNWEQDLKFADFWNE